MSCSSSSDADNPARLTGSATDVATAAIAYLLQRVQEDPDLRYVMLDSEALHRLCAAYAALTGRSLDEVEGIIRERRPRGEARIVKLLRHIKELGT